MKRFAVAVLALALAGCGRAPQASTRAAMTPPNVAVGELVSYGRRIITDTPHTMKGYVSANMSCEACHPKAGTARAGSLAGIYGQFPQWNARAHRVISLQDRIAECFLYSMNGRPPAYESRPMEAIVAYIASLSRGTPVGAMPDPANGTPAVVAPHAASAVRGAGLYAQRCSSCHQATGAGVNGSFPPLWGATSFNDGAGMHRLRTMAAFVRYAMPQNAPGSLTDQQAYDVSAFVLHHARPHFQRNRLVTFPARRAGYF